MAFEVLCLHNLHSFRTIQPNFRTRLHPIKMIESFVYFTIGFVRRTNGQECSVFRSDNILSSYYVCFIFLFSYVRIDFDYVKG